MKLAFATALVAAIATAQDAVPAETVVEEKSTLDKMRDAMVVNEMGNLEFPTPDIPKLSFSDISDQAVIDWAKGKESEYTAMDQKWVDAWNSYQSAVAGPWNAFLDQVEALDKEQD